MDATGRYAVLDEGALLNAFLSESASGGGLAASAPDARAGGWQWMMLAEEDTGSGWPQARVARCSVTDRHDEGALACTALTAALAPDGRRWLEQRADI